MEERRGKSGRSGRTKLSLINNETICANFPDISRLYSSQAAKHPSKPKKNPKDDHKQRKCHLDGKILVSEMQLNRTVGQICVQEFEVMKENKKKILKKEIMKKGDTKIEVVV